MQAASAERRRLPPPISGSHNIVFLNTGPVNYHAPPVVGHEAALRVQGEASGGRRPTAQRLRVRRNHETRPASREEKVHEDKKGGGCEKGPSCADEGIDLPDTNDDFLEQGQQVQEPPVGQGQPVQEPAVPIPIDEGFLEYEPFLRPQFRRPAPMLHEIQVRGPPQFLDGGTLWYMLHYRHLYESK